MEDKNYYSVLGVSPDASLAEIKSAYKKLARKYHPDVSTEADAQEKFKEVGEAYEVLRDPEKRSEYDQLRAYIKAGGSSFRGKKRTGQSSFGGEDVNFEDLMNSIFGTRAGYHHEFNQDAIRRRGENLRYHLRVTLEEAFAGGEKQISLPVGNGARKIKVKIPAGVTSGKELRLKGQGGKGQGGASDGDLFLEIDLLAHDLYAVDGKNLTLILPVTPWEAALGSSLEVSTLSGKVRLTIPSNSQSGKKFRLRGKGLGSDPSGDLYVVLKIVNPPVVTDQEKQSFDRLAELFDFNPRAEKVI